MAILTTKEYLMRYRNCRCPEHGYGIANSLVKYSGYCSICNQFWKFIRYIEMKDIPYYWWYFDPDNPKMKIGKCRGGRVKGK